MEKNVTTINQREISRQSLFFRNILSRKIFATNLRMFKLTFPYMSSILWHSKRAILLLILFSIVLGFVPTLKSDLEAGVIDQASYVMLNHSTNIFGGQLIYFSAANSISSGGFDIIKFIETIFFSKMSLIVALIVYLGITVLAAFVSFKANAYRKKISTQVFSGLRSEGFQKGLGTDPSNLPKLSNVAGNYAEAIQQGALNVSGTYDSLLSIGQYAFSLLTTLFVVATLNLIFALCILVIVMVQALVSIIQAHRLEERRKQLDSKRNDLVAKTDDILDKREVILAFDRKDFYTGEIDEYAQKYGKVRQEILVQEEKYRSIKDVVGSWGFISVIAVALVLFILFRSNSTTTLGNTVFLITIYWRILEPVTSILDSYDNIRSSTATSKTFLDVLEGCAQPSASDLPADNAAVPPSNQEQAACITFTNVSFSYKTEAKQEVPLVLKNCSFVVPANAMTLVLGRSGIGKSTVARIILGFWPIDEGEVFIEGKESRLWQQEELLKLMSYVAQDDNIIDATVRENLSWAYSKNPISDELMLSALAEVGLKDKVDLEKQAKSLSGGQKQRLSIARLVLDESPIAILDEPLTGLDVFTLEEILPVLVEKVIKRPDRTVLIFSHNLALATYANQIIVLGDGGSVVEHGEPKQLLQAGGIFARLHQTAREEFSIK